MNGGIFLAWQDRNTIIRNNFFDKIYPFPGMGKNGNMQGTAIYMRETSSEGLVEANHIKDSGYILINFNGDKTIVKGDFINNFCFVKDDGAGICTFLGISGKHYFATCMNSKSQLIFLIIQYFSNKKNIIFRKLKILYI